ncbi:MAG: hypothetical protein KDA48_09090, partial [Amphiplicatus sp.]|nr:hypothetical protein [Amphiplicatus sp.]
IVSSSKDTITIASGLAAGERVAISPLRGADDGSEVVPVDPNAPETPTTAGGEPTVTAAGDTL